MEALDQTPDIATLAAEWYDAFHREALLEDGDPDAYVESLREAADAASPNSAMHGAFAVFMERLREDDMDLETDASDVAP